MVGEHFYAHLIDMFLNDLIILLLFRELIMKTVPLAKTFIGLRFDSHKRLPKSDKFVDDPVSV